LISTSKSLFSKRRSLITIKRPARRELMDLTTTKAQGRWTLTK
jgi:hypothetical protein